MTQTPTPSILLTDQLDKVDWPALKRAVADDGFDNGRTASELEASFTATRVRVFALSGERVVGTARALSDGVCNALIVDVWTQSAFRRQGLASRMVQILESRLEGHHVALFTDAAAGFYGALGYREERVGMSRVVGTWLRREARLR